MVASAVLAGTYGAVSGVPVERPTLALVVVSSLGLWTGFLALPLLTARTRGGAGAFLALRIRPLVDIPLGVATGLASTLLASIVTSLALDRSQRGELEGKATDVIDRAQAPAAVVLLVLVLAVATPVAEEVFFRGLLFRSMARVAPVPVAVVVSGLLFGLVHFSGGSAEVVVDQLGLLGAFGAALCLLTWRTGRLGGAIVAHATFNLFTVIAQLVQR